jgi:hypothetical protein
MSHLRQAVERLKRTAGADGVTRIVVANEGESRDEALAASSVKPRHYVAAATKGLPQGLMRLNPGPYN